MVLSVLSQLGRKPDLMVPDGCGTMAGRLGLGVGSSLLKIDDLHRIIGQPAVKRNVNKSHMTTHSVVSRMASF